MKKIKVTKLIKWFIVLTMVLCICSGFVVAGKGYSMYRNALDQIKLSPSRIRNIIRHLKNCRRCM